MCIDIVEFLLLIAMICNGRAPRSSPFITNHSPATIHQGAPTSAPRSAKAFSWYQHFFTQRFTARQDTGPLIAQDLHGPTQAFRGPVAS